MGAVSRVSESISFRPSVSFSLILAEPNVVLTGSGYGDRPHLDNGNSTALLRGKLYLNVSRKVKLKSVTLKLTTKAQIERLKGRPLRNTGKDEDEAFRTQILTFFHAMHGTWETEYGNRCAFWIRHHARVSAGVRPLEKMAPQSPISAKRWPGNLISKKSKGLSLQPVEARMLQDERALDGTTTSLKSFKVFYPGIYEYSFELPIDHHQLETINLQFGSVKWELETLIERGGVFKQNLHGSKEISVVRIPDYMSLETVEPISLSGQWEDQLQYDIIISGRSFPIGTKIPINLKLMPLAKVQVHKMKVYVIESTKYWIDAGWISRKDTTKRILLLEKSAERPMNKRFEQSEFRTQNYNEVPSEGKGKTRAASTKRRNRRASRSHEPYRVTTGIEMNVHIPTCRQMAKDKSLRLNADCSWTNVRIEHRVKIVMGISRIDPEDLACVRRCYLDISVDSPFTLLNCRATLANTSLPEYSRTAEPMNYRYPTCGCPDANVLTRDVLPFTSTGIIPEPLNVETTPLATPPLIHPPTQARMVKPRALTRLTLIRCVPFNSLTFREYDATVSMHTPPPQYDCIIGTPSGNSLADYEEADGDSTEGVSGRSARSWISPVQADVTDLRSPSESLVPKQSLEFAQNDARIDTMAGALME